MAAAIAASAIASFGLEARAQTTGGGIGANVNGNAGASGNLPTQGTTGTAGGTATSGIAAPNVPVNPLTPGTGPGINNTGSPVLGVPRTLGVPIGGSGPLTPRGTSRIPGNAIPVNPRINPPVTTGVNGAVQPQPLLTPTTGTAGGTVVVPNDTLKGNLGTAGASAGLGASMRMGTLTDFTDSTISFKEGANTSTLMITPDTVVQMDGQNVALSAIPANSQVRIERSPTNANQVRRIVVVPQTGATGAASANASAQNSVHMQTGTGSTGSANRSLPTTGPNDTGFSRGGTEVNRQSGTGSNSRASTGTSGGSSRSTRLANTGSSARTTTGNRQATTRTGGALGTTNQAGAVTGNAGLAAGGGGVGIQTGTGAVPNQTGIGDFGGATDITAGTGNGAPNRANLGDFGGATTGTRTGAPTGANTTPGGDINAATGTSRTPGGDINAATGTSRTPGGDINAATVNRPNTSNRPLAPGSTNPADQPLTPMARGGEQHFQAGFSDPRALQQQAQGQAATTDGSQFLGPVNGAGVGKPNPSGSKASGQSVDTGANAAVNLPNNGVTPAGQAAPARDPRRRGDSLFTGPIANRFGMELSDTNEGLTIGSVSNQSLAARSGLRAGDRIQSINGTNVTTAADFARALQGANQNQAPITASVMRNGAAQNLNMSLPNGFFNGITIPPAGVAVGPDGSTGVAVGNGNIAVAPDGSTGVNVGGVIVPATGPTQAGANGVAATGAVGATGIAGAAATVPTSPAAQTTTQEQQTVVQGQTPTRVRPVDVPVAAHRGAVTTEALKIPDVNLGWTLKPTPEGVVMSSIVQDGLAAQNKFESGDIIESIDDRPITAPGAVSYELHRHRAGATVKFGILRNGRRFTEDVTLPKDHQPLLLDRSETFGQANNDAKDAGGSGAKPLPVKPTEESVRTLEEQNQALRKELEAQKKK